MAKVHKAHKSSKKYGFQKKKFSVKTLLIVLAVVIVAAIGLKIAYDNYVYGEIAVAAPTNEQLNNIAANWRKLEADTENFMNPYAVPATEETAEETAEEAADETAETTDDAAAAAEEVVADGTDGQGGAYLLYVGNENIDSAYIYVNAGELDTETTDVESFGAFARTTLTDWINGVAPWGHTDMQLQIANANCYIGVYDSDPATLDDAAMAEVLAAVEAALAAE